MVHPAGDTAFVLVVLAGLFLGGWVVEGAGFGAILVLMALGLLAVAIPLMFINQEESSLPFRRRRIGGTTPHGLS